MALRSQFDFQCRRQSVDTKDSHEIACVLCFFLFDCLPEQITCEKRLGCVEDTFLTEVERVANAVAYTVSQAKDSQSLCPKHNDFTAKR